VSWDSCERRQRQRLLEELLDELTTMLVRVTISGMAE
jgi:hypothetical protein